MYFEKIINTYGLKQSNFNPFIADSTSTPKRYPKVTGNDLGLEPPDCREMVQEAREVMVSQNADAKGRYEPTNPLLDV